MATFSIKGKVAVVTGGSRGIGKAVAEALVARGGYVVIGDVLDKEGQQTVQELNSHHGQDGPVAGFVHTDVTVYKDVIALFRYAESTFGGVDIAFLNAGILDRADNLFLPLEDDIEADLPRINITGVVKCTKCALLHMAKRGGGVIVNTASTAGFQKCFQMSHYFATKHAVVGWTRSVGSMLKDICNVRVNAVCPAWVETNMHTKTLNREGDDPYKELVKHSPTTDIQTVVRGVLTLIEDESRNAQTLLTLPGDVVRVQEAIPDYEETNSPEFVAAVKKNYGKTLDHYRKQLEQAMERYGLEKK